VLTAAADRLLLCIAVLRVSVSLLPVYDVTRRATLESLSGSWMAELESYQPHRHVARMVVANKVDAVRRCACCCLSRGCPLVGDGWWLEGACVV
jgi:hypothetical protein